MDATSPDERAPDPEPADPAAVAPAAAVPVVAPEQPITGRLVAGAAVEAVLRGLALGALLAAIPLACRIVEGAGEFDLVRMEVIARRPSWAVRANDLSWAQAMLVFFLFGLIAVPLSAIEAIARRGAPSVGRDAGAAALSLATAASLAHVLMAPVGHQFRKVLIDLDIVRSFLDHKAATTGTFQSWAQGSENHHLPMLACCFLIPVVVAAFTRLRGLPLAQQSLIGLVIAAFPAYADALSMVPAGYSPYDRRVLVAGLLGAAVPVAYRLIDVVVSRWWPGGAEES